MEMTDEQARIIGREIGKQLKEPFERFLERLGSREEIKSGIVVGIKESVNLDGPRMLDHFLRNANRNRHTRGDADDFADRIAEAIARSWGA